MRTTRVESVVLGPEVEAFLKQAGLPVSDLSPSATLKLLGVRDSGQLTGAVGIESFGAVGLLRSLAVSPEHRKKGVGAELVSDAESWACEHGIETLYLLTPTAAGFFARLGYETTSRSEAPAAIAATAQFKDLCPASSVFMCKALADNRSR